MNFVLVKPPFIPVKYGPPIGLGYLSKVLKDNNHTVTIVDLNKSICETFPDIGKYNRDYKLPPDSPVVRHGYEKIDQFCSQILELSPDIVGFSLHYPSAEYGIALAKKLCSKVRCIAGGPLVNYMPESYLEIGCFDTIICGPGEEAILDAVHTKGIIKKELVGSKEYKPDYTDIPISDYNGCLTVVTSRGCPNQCSFCTHNSEYYRHSVDSVVEQIKKAENVTSILYNDSNINVDGKRTEHLFSQIAKLDKKVPGHIFGLQVRPGFEGYIEKMAAAGVNEVRLGVETGSARERKSMNKELFDNDLIVDFIKELHKYKIKVWNQLIFCYPDQTDDDRQLTINLMNRINEECNPEYVTHYWFKFIVLNDRSDFMKNQYGVTRKSLQDWQNDSYTPEIINSLARRYEKIIPKNAEIWL